MSSWGIEAAYRRIFGRECMQRFNDYLYHLTLHAKGYGNYEDLKVSGEDAFFHLLSKLDPDLCIDVGANVGTYTQRVLEYTNARVLAFEPLPQSFTSLEKIEGRFPGRLTAVNKGVGNAPGVLDLHYGAEHTQHASFASEVANIDYVGRENVDVCEVEITTLDDYLDASPLRDAAVTLLKIDTEGFEYEVLTGAKKTIAERKPKCVQIEYNLHQMFRGHSLYGLSTLLPGYVPFQLLPYGSGMRKVNPKSADANIFMFSNFVFIRPDVLSTLS